MTTNTSTIKRDIYLGPLRWIGFRLIVSALAGVLVGIILKLIFSVLYFWGFIPTDPISFTILFSIMALAAIYFAMPEESVENVPETNYGALVTFLGMPLHLIRTTGKYDWTGKRLGFDRTRKISPEATDDNGFIILGDITFQVWNSSSAKKGEVGRSKITIPAKNRAPVSGSLTLIMNLHEGRPVKWLDANDPALDIGDRARQEYQEIIETLVDTDVPAIQAHMQAYLMGKKMITSFITENVGSHKAGSIIRDETGLVMFRPLEDGETDDDARRNFLLELSDRADPKMLKAITKKKKLADGSTVTEVAIKILKVSDPLSNVTQERGAVLRRVTFGDVTLSQKVTDAAEQASAESDERRSQLDSAKTNREARKLLLPTPKELENPELYQLTTILAAAQDDKTGNIRVVMVPGGDRLSNAVIAAGGQIGGK